MLKYDYTVETRKKSGHTVDITVKVLLPDKSQATPPLVLSYIRSHLLKQSLATDWVQPNYPGYGLSLQGGPRPLLSEQNTPGIVGEIEGKPQGELLGYQQDFRLTKGL